MPPRPKGFVSYSWDSEAHQNAVLQLAQRLRAKGIDVMMDRFCESDPPANWPQWMFDQIETADYVLVVCSEGYQRRAYGKEEPGTGRGVSWEAGIITNELYSRDPRARTKFIPVLLRPEDETHIPYFIGNTSRHIVGPDGQGDIEALLRQITRQPAIVPGQLGLLPELPPHEPSDPLVADLDADLITALRQAPGGLPCPVLALGLRQDNARIESALVRLEAQRLITRDIGAAWASAVEGPPQGASTHRPEMLVRVLEEAVSFAKEAGNDPRSRRIMPSILEMAAQCANAYPRDVAPIFKIVEKILKKMGDKRGLFQLAKVCVEAARREPRGRDETMLEAQAVICGISWVHQRTGFLPEARAEAERSLKLGSDVHYERNTAFCWKCLGRLYRLEAERERGPKRQELLDSSEKCLRTAIDSLTEQQEFEEVGDCFSLLARTKLVRGDIKGARQAADDAWDRIVDKASKDYLDLCIVSAEVAWQEGQRIDAMQHVGAAISSAKADDAEFSEIVARAYLARARFRWLLGQKDQALGDCQQAEQISTTLREPDQAAQARWVALELQDKVSPEMTQALGDRPYAVRMRAIDLRQSQLAARNVGVARRAKTSSQQWGQLVLQATQQLAVENPAW